MIFVYAEPNYSDSDKAVTLAISANTSGLNFSGLGASLQRYGALDIDLASATAIRSFVTDAYGAKTFRIKAGDLGSDAFTLGVKYTNGSDVGTVDLEISSFGKLALQLDDLLCAFRHIERFEEPGRISEDGLSAQWGWGNWHIDPAPVIMKNTNTWLQNSYQIDYKKGIVYFNTPLEAGEEVRANYSMRLLDLSIYKSFFATALGMINNTRRFSAFYDSTNYPTYFDTLLVLYAFILASRVIAPKLSTFRYRRLFEQPDQLLSTLQANASVASADWAAWFSNLKRRGPLTPAAISTYRIGQDSIWAYDGISINNLIVSRM